MRERFMLLLLYLVLGALFILAVIRRDEALWMLFGVYVGFIAYETAVWISFDQAWQGLRVVTETVVQAGASIRVSVEASARKRSRMQLALIHIEDDLPKFLDCEKVAIDTSQHVYRVQYDVHQLVRGVYDFSKIMVSGRDLFGLIQRKVDIPCETHVLVYPHVMRIARWRMLDDIVQCIHEHELYTALSLENGSGTRLYRPGDRLSQIHWVSSARTDELRVLEVERTAEKAMAILLHTPTLRETHGDDSFAPLFELSLSVVASVAQYALQSHVTIDYYDASQSTDVIVTGNNIRAIAPLLKELAKAVPSDGSVQYDFDLFCHLEGIILVVVTTSLQILFHHVQSKRMIRPRSVIIFYVCSQEYQLSELDLETIATFRAREVHVAIIHSHDDFIRECL